MQNNSLLKYTATFDRKCFYPSIGTALKETMYRIKQINDSIPTKPQVLIDDTSKRAWVNQDGSEKYVEFTTILELMPDLSRSDSGDHFEDDISALKKRIKYAKTPMERKQLSQQLNMAYKKKKKENK